ncbi:hypothetical protein ACIGW4_15025 [Streptomyces sp. NPDC053513]|uniref:hypothetical protein n=1 Tax=unclassified Streptomyces TaxID=2593676 RepID=UPI0037D6BCE3
MPELTASQRRARGAAAVGVGAVATVMIASGTFLGLVADDFTWVFIGQAVAAAGQPFLLNAIPGLAVGYIAEKHHATGIAAASSATFAGTARKTHRGVPSGRAVNWTFMPCCLCFCE